jgi:hypothetical protein
MKRIDLTGRTLGHWTVLGPSERVGPRGELRWICRCRCGREIDRDGASIRSGGSSSCGCFRKHGHTSRNGSSPTYSSWEKMWSRVRGKDELSIRNYASRGITVCDRWRDFSSFLADMGERQTGMSLDRIDNNGNYEPGNCRWADMSTQLRNRRNNIWLEYAGRRWVLADLARAYGIPKTTLRTRIVDLKWAVERAVTTPGRASAPAEPPVDAP